MTGTSARDTVPRLSAVSPLDPGDPRRVGRYLLSGRLGAGGMGTVYLGRAEQGGPPVAVKVVHRELAGDADFRSRFADEVAAARRVAPFCTARVLDADPAATPPYLVTEFIDGVPLGTAVGEGGPLDESTLHGVALGVAAALAAVHAAGVVHRDLKPANVLLSLSGPRVIDFGIARALDSARQHTQVGTLIGTPGWMAPEQFRGGSIGPPSDVFSWGSLVAYAATGRNPWGAEGPPTALAHRILHGEPDLAGLTGPLRRHVEAALRKDPVRRPTARQLVDALLGGQRPAGPPVPMPADPTVAASRLVEQTWTGVPAFRGPPGHPAGGPPGNQPGHPPGWPAGNQPGHPAGRPAGNQPGHPAGQPAGNQPGQLGNPADRPDGTPAGVPVGRPGGGAGGKRRRWPARPRPAPTKRAPRPTWAAPPPVARRPAPTRKVRRSQAPPAAPPPAPVTAPAPARRRRRWYRKKRWLVPLALLAAYLLLPRATPETTALPGQDRPAHDLGRPVRDGQLEFVVDEWRCGVRSLGSGGLVEEPQGGYCLATVSATNVGDGSRTLLEPFQKLRDGADRTYTAEFTARFAFPDQTLWSAVRPGERVRGTMAFDVPTGADPVRLELHDGPLSGGARVRLP